MLDLGYDLDIVGQQPEGLSGGTWRCMKRSSASGRNSELTPHASIILVTAGLFMLPLAFDPKHPEKRICLPALRECILNTSRIAPQSLSELRRPKISAFRLNFVQPGGHFRLPPAYNHTKLRPRGAEPEVADTRTREFLHFRAFRPATWHAV